jgi:hypothetical protein
VISDREDQRSENAIVNLVTLWEEDNPITVISVALGIHMVGRQMMRWRDLYSQKRSLNLRKERQQRRRLEDSMVSDIFMGGGRYTPCSPIKFPSNGSHLPSIVNVLPDPVWPLDKKIANNINIMKSALIGFSDKMNTVCTSLILLLRFNQSNTIIISTN